MLENYYGLGQERMFSSGKISEVLMHDYRGPRAGFSQAHVVKAIITIGQLATVGRGRLGELLGLGQGETRTLIRRLKQKNLIRVESSGCVLTDLGEREYNSIAKILTPVGEVDARFLGIGRYSWCFILSGKSSRIRKGIEQRDASILEGAMGALTLVYKDGRFRVPADKTDCEKANPSGLWNTIREKGQPKQEDVIIISGAENREAAELGGWSAVLATI